MGKLGIGIAIPESKLDINGLLTVRNEGDNSAIEFLAANNKSASIGVQDDNDQGFYIFTGGAYRLNVNQNGNIGIGTTTPSTTLDVNGTGHFNGNVGIGITTPSTTLDVNGNRAF